MQNRKLLFTAAALLAFVASAALVSMVSGSKNASAGVSTPTATPCPPDWEPAPTPDHCIDMILTHTQSSTPCPTDTGPDPIHGGCIPITPTPTTTPCPTDTGPDPIHGGCIPITPTPTTTPCPTGSVPDTYHGSGCGTPTPSPTSNRPPPVPHIDLMVNGQQGPVTVRPRESLTVSWVLSNQGSGHFQATIDDQLANGLDGICSLDAGMQCSQSAEVTFFSAGQFVDTVTVAAFVPPAVTNYASDSVTINVVSLLGDFNCDRAINSIDAAIILQISAGMIVPLPCTGDADVNHDGDLTAIDAALILQYTAGLITEFP